jgi:hypothetical protein
MDQARPSRADVALHADDRAAAQRQRRRRLGLQAGQGLAQAGAADAHHLAAGQLRAHLARAGVQHDGHAQVVVVAVVLQRLRGGTLEVGTGQRRARSSWSSGPRQGCLRSCAITARRSAACAACWSALRSEVTTRRPWV